MVRRWAKELLGYDFAVVHSPKITMTDVDSLRSSYGKLIATHVGVASILKYRDLRRPPDAYHHKYCFACKKSKMNNFPNLIEPRHIFTTQNIMKVITSTSYKVLL